MDIVPIDETSREMVDAVVRESWGGPMMVSNGRVLDTSGHPGFMCVEDGRLLGFATYWIEAGECELTCMEALAGNRGLGSALLERVCEAAREAGCRRMFLVTTNDNTRAIRFYQRRGMSLCAVRLNELDRSRALKPGIPLTGMDGIPLLHEFEFEYRL